MADLSLLPPILARDPVFAELDAINQRISNLDITCLFVYDIDRVPASALPALASQFSLDDEMFWSLATDEATKRNLIKNAIEIHRYKGTPWAVKNLLSLLGFADVQIVEGLSDWVLDGTVELDGSHTLGEPTGWAKYMLISPNPIENATCAIIAKALQTVAPAHAHLISIDYSSNGPQLDGSWTLSDLFCLGTYIVES